MITAITFQWMHSKKYDNESLVLNHTYGDRTTDDLLTVLRNDLIIYQKMIDIVADINRDLANADVKSVIQFHTNGELPNIRHKTKTKRVYHYGGLAIHEDDN